MSEEKQANTEEVPQLIQVKKGLDKFKDRKLWYFDFQGEIFPYTLNTRKGYMVMRNDDSENRMWLVKHKHAQEVKGTIL